MKNKIVKVRFAPSPTGELHIGSARTALFNFLFARHNKGKIVLRIEDTDVKRYVPGSVERLMDSLKWLGIEFDEYPMIKNTKSKALNPKQIQSSKSKTINENCKLKIENSCGKYGPYIQSQRLNIYQEYAEKLVEDGKAYYCFCSEKRLKKMRDEQMKRKQAPMYDRTCIDLTPTEIREKLENKKPYVIRMKVPYSGMTVFDDLVRGRVEIDNSTIDDQILVKSDGMPTYHLANVIDDHLMEITHVLRAEEWLPSTPKHIILYNAFGWKTPEFGHIPLVLAPDRSKLSKRYGAVSIEEFKKIGYLPEALANYVALLGWNPKNEKEFFSIQELVNEFDISKINKAGAIFDRDKLDYFNGHYLRQMPIEELKRLIIDNSKQKLESKNLGKIITIVKDRMVKLSDFEELSKMFFGKLNYDSKILIFKKSNKESTLEGLKRTAYDLQHTALSDWESIEKLNGKLLNVVKERELANGDVFWPVRVALSGQEKSPSPSEILWVLGKDESLKRINSAVAKLSKEQK